MQMPAEMLTAMKAQLVEPARGWRVMSAMPDQHTETVVVDLVPTEVIKRTATLTLQSDVMGKAIILMLAGEGAGTTWSAGKAIFGGNSFDFTDAELLTWCKNAIAALSPVVVVAVLEQWFGEIPSADDGEA